MAALENLDNAGGRARSESRPASLKTACIDGMEAVYILLRHHGVEQEFGVDLRGKRKLDEDAVDVVAGVEAVD